MFKVASIEERKREEKMRGKNDSLVASPWFRKKLLKIAETEEKEAEGMSSDRVIKLPKLIILPLLSKT